jgi:hypothetical protein
MLLHEQGYFKEAEALENEVLDTRSRILGVKHPDTIRAMENLAATYRKLGKYSEAEKLDIQVLESCKKWPQNAGKEDINFDALISTSAAGDVLDAENVRQILSAIQKVMEDLKADASQILPADEAATQLHTIFDPVFSSKHSCKTLVNFQGDDAKIVLNSLQWVSCSISSSNLCFMLTAIKSYSTTHNQTQPKGAGCFQLCFVSPAKVGYTQSVSF